MFSLWQLMKTLYVTSLMCDHKCIRCLKFHCYCKKCFLPYVNLWIYFWIFALIFFYWHVFSWCSPADILLFAVPPIYEKNKVSVTLRPRSWWIYLMAKGSQTLPERSDDSCSRTYQSAVSSLDDCSPHQTLKAFCIPFVAVQCPAAENMKSFHCWVK